MSAPASPLTDRQALIRNRRRAGIRQLPLHEEAIVAIQDRLALVNRAFTSPAIVTGQPEPWAIAFPDATIVPDDEVLTLEPAAHDLVVHALSLHWANDPVGQLIQCRRALGPDGLMLALFPGGQTLHELRAVLAEAEVHVTGGLSPRVLPMADIRDAGGLMQRAGFAMPVADSETVTLDYADLFAMMRDIRAAGEANAQSARLRRPTRRAVLLEATRLYSDTYALPSGRLPATIEMITLTGWAPGENQPQPLRPGSATARLADALGVNEGELPD